MAKTLRTCSPSRRLLNFFCAKNGGVPCEWSMMKILNSPTALRIIFCSMVSRFVSQIVLAKWYLNVKFGCTCMITQRVGWEVLYMTDNLLWKLYTCRLSIMLYTGFVSIVLMWMDAHRSTMPAWAGIVKLLNNCVITMQMQQHSKLSIRCMCEEIIEIWKFIGCSKLYIHKLIGGVVAVVRYFNFPVQVIILDLKSVFILSELCMVKPQWMQHSSLQTWEVVWKVWLKSWIRTACFPEVMMIQNNLTLSM